jgi:hypothetical protein
MLPSPAVFMSPPLISSHTVSPFECECGILQQALLFLPLLSNIEKRKTFSFFIATVLCFPLTYSQVQGFDFIKKVRENEMK